MDENPSEAIPGAIEDMEDGHKDDIHVSAKPDIPQDDIHEETESEAVAGPEKVSNREIHANDCMSRLQPNFNRLVTLIQ